MTEPAETNTEDIEELDEALDVLQNVLENFLAHGFEDKELGNAALNIKVNDLCISLVNAMEEAYDATRLLRNAQKGEAEP